MMESAVMNIMEHLNMHVQVCFRFFQVHSLFYYNIFTVQIGNLHVVEKMVEEIE